MKQSIINIFFISLLTNVGWGQSLELKLNNTRGIVGEIVTIELSTKDFSAIGSFQFSIHWDSTIFQYVETFDADLFPTPLVGDTDSNKGILRCSWFDPQGIGQSLPDGSILMELDFRIKTCEKMESSISFSDIPLSLQVSKIIQGTPQIIAANLESSLVEIINQESFLGPDTIICEGETLTLSLDTTCSNCSYLWEDESTDSFLIVNNEGVFTVTITDSNGCMSEDEIKVSSFSNPSININEIIPAINTITPNGDGINDELRFPNIEKLGTNKLVIWNRWGTVVCEEIDYRNNFTGNSLNEGVYFYELSFANIDATIRSSINILKEKP